MLRAAEGRFSADEEEGLGAARSSTLTQSGAPECSRHQIFILFSKTSRQL